MKTFTTLLICLFFLTPFDAFTQDLVKEGVIILHSGDILSGEIRCRNWSQTPQKIMFRSKGQELFTEFGTEEIRFFEAGGERYWRADVLIDRNPVDIHLDPGELLPKHSMALEAKTVFLKCIVSGTKYDLLELSDNTKDHYYLRDRAGIVTLLEYKVYLNKSHDVERVFGFRQTLSEINRREENDPAIENAIKSSLYYASSLSKIVEVLNRYGGNVTFKTTFDRQGKTIRFFAGAAGGITMSIPRRDWGLRRATGNIAGIIAGLDISMGYSCNGGESFFRFDVLAARILYAANVSDPKSRRIHESLQYAIVPSMKVRLPLFTFKNFNGHFGGGFTTPIHLSEKEMINRWKYSSLEDEFPWVAITVGGQVDFEIKNRWEVGLGCYQAPSVDFNDNYIEPVHCYTWIAYRF